MSPVQVVAGVLFHPYERGQQLLGCRRAEPYQGTWEHPGGKMNPGETHQQALAREWREELGIEVEVSPLPAGYYADPYGSVHVILYVVKLADPSPLPDWPDTMPKDGPAHVRFIWADLRWVMALPRFKIVPSLKTLAHAADLLA